MSDESSVASVNDLLIECRSRALRRAFEDTPLTFAGWIRYEEHVVWRGRQYAYSVYTARVGAGINYGYETLVPVDDLAEPPAPSTTRYSRPLSQPPRTFVGGLSWEIDESGHHRVVGPGDVAGEWAHYESIATSADGRHAAVTQYWDGTLPVETIFQLVPLVEEAQDGSRGSER